MLPMTEDARRQYEAEMLEVSAASEDARVTPNGVRKLFNEVRDTLIWYSGLKGKGVSELSMDQKKTLVRLRRTAKYYLDKLDTTDSMIPEKYKSTYRGVLQRLMGNKYSQADNALVSEINMNQSSDLETA